MEAVAMVVARATDTTKQTYPNQGPTFTIVSSTMTAIAGVLVVFRVCQTFVRRRTVVLEDTMVIGALVADVLSTVVGCQAIHYGFGKHGKDIKPSGGNVTLALQYFFLFQIFYKLVLGFNKMSFLLLYHRIFQQKTFRVICKCTIGVVLAGTGSMLIVTVFQCIPVSKSWNKHETGHCVSNAGFRWAWASYNTATDLWVCLLPMPVIWQLQMRLAQRLGIMLVFALGLFVCVTSIIRIHALTESVATTDPTWGSLPAFVWSSVEASTGLICACLPSLKQPIQACFPRLFGHYTKSGSRGNTYAMDRYGPMDSKTGGTNTSRTQHHQRFPHQQTRWHDDDDTVDDYHKPANKATTFISVGNNAAKAYDKGTSPRESQERIIETPAGGLGGITMTTDISLKSDQASDVEDSTPKRTYHAY